MCREANHTRCIGYPGAHVAKFLTAQHPGLSRSIRFKAYVFDLMPYRTAKRISLGVPMRLKKCST